MRVLLIGLGRMGKRYIQVLNRLHPTDLEIVTVDPQSEGVPNTRHFTNLGAIPSGHYDLAIDAHPNTHRSEILESLMDRGIRKIISEKPHAQSLEESRRMIDMAGRSGAEVMLPFYLQFADAFKLETLQKLDAGKLCTMNLVAGAIGFGCNGVHHLNFGNQLFGSEPVSIWGDIQANAIASPRGQQFRDHGGLLVVKYPNGSMVLNIQAQSATGIQTTLLFENGKIQYSESNEFKWEWWRRKREDDSQPSYRTHLELPVTPPVPYTLDIIEIMTAGVDAFMKGGPYSTLQDGHRVLKMIALGMVSSRTRREIAWSDDQQASDITFSFT